MLRITESLLVGLSGRAAFERGREYFEKDAVVSLVKKGKSIHAEVQGDKLYQVELRRTAKVFEGECECPASDGLDFCKHCVAAALQLKRQDEAADTPAKLGGTKQQQLDSLRNWLGAKPKAELLESLLAYIDADKVERDRWLMRLEIATGDRGLRSLQKFITNTTRITKTIERPRDVRRLFDKLEASLEQLYELASDVHPTVVIELASYGMQRLDRMLHYVEDDAGHHLQSAALLQDMLAAGLANLETSDADRMSRLVGVWQRCEFAIVGDVPGDYATLFEEDAQTLYHDEIKRRWEQLPPLPEDAEYEDSLPYRELMRALRKYYLSRGERELAMEVTEKATVEAEDMLALVESWLQLGNAERAQYWLDRYDKRREDRPAPGYSQESVKRQELEMQLHAAQGNPAAAAELSWEKFLSALSMPSYKVLQRFAEQSKAQGVYKDRAVDYLSKKMTNNSGSAERTPNKFRNLLVSVLLFHKDLDRAWEFAHGHALYENNLVSLARQSPKKYQNYAVESLKRMIAVTVQRANNGAYQDAVSLVGEVEALSSQEDFSEYLAKLRDSFRSKRNFIGYLDEAYPR